MGEIHFSKREWKTADRSRFRELQDEKLRMLLGEMDGNGFYNIRVAAERVPAGSLPRYEFKARRFKRTSG